MPAFKRVPYDFKTTQSRTDRPSAQTVYHWVRHRIIVSSEVRLFHVDAVAQVGSNGNIAIPGNEIDPLAILTNRTTRAFLRAYERFAYAF